MHRHTIQAMRKRFASRLTIAASCAAALLAGGAAAAQPGAATSIDSRTRPRVIVDPAVVPAGGAPCRHCGPRTGPLHGGHLNACRDGLCAPHCPVRPDQHGYYRTQWRRWPGEGVVPASAQEATTPAPPPTSQVPSVDEESPQAPVLEPAPPGEAAELPTDPLPEPPGEAGAEPPAGRAKPVAPEPAAPEPQPPVPPTPPGEPALAPQPGDTDAAFVDPPAAPTPAGGEEPVETGTMRYPGTIGRSLAAGGVPWRLRPPGRQRPAESARGL